MSFLPLGPLEVAVQTSRGCLVSEASRHFPVMCHVSFPGSQCYKDVLSYVNMVHKVNYIYYFWFYICHSGILLMFFITFSD